MRDTLRTSAQTCMNAAYVFVSMQVIFNLYLTSYSELFIFRVHFYIIIIVVYIIRTQNTLCSDLVVIVYFLWILSGFSFCSRFQDRVSWSHWFLVWTDFFNLLYLRGFKNLPSVNYHQGISQFLWPYFHLVKHIRYWVYQIAMPAFLLHQLYEDLFWHAYQGRYHKQASMSWYKMWRYGPTCFVKTVAWWWEVWTMGVLDVTKNTRFDVWCFLLPEMWNTLHRRWGPACCMLKVLL